MQLVITSAEKLNLYHVCDEENWVNVIDSDLRRKLLNEEYEISNSFEHSIGKAAVISFKKGVTFNDIRIEDEVMVIEMSEEEGINFITKSVKEIRELVDGVPIAGSKPSKPDESTNTTQPSKNIGLDDEEKLTPPEIVTDEPETVIKPVQVVNDPIESYIPEDKNEERNMEILFGINEKNNKEVYWYIQMIRIKYSILNTGIIGTMGTGKTQFTKSMVTQIYRESKYNVDGKDVGILIFDYKGDYNKSKTDFIKATNANVYELYHLPFNPLSVIKAANSKPMLPLHTANSLKVTLAKAFGLGIKQETLLRDLIMEAYEKRGIVKNNADTWDKPAPTLKDVYDIYVNREDLKEDSLYAA